ncbi:HD domain-containing phosphohydrolase [Mesoterricola silvestris]|uniref:Two-component system response regulator n=1 Tax=Mesoterricola silvestris TaxID=2927979 RepID=A0AA48K7P1_9BACT|nr:HD domain-containing phosphohydrolase [Mesoterricola silvestris]BDU72094.1 two-component system response regulator [Mesoterricola silvestris]
MSPSGRPHALPIDWPLPGHAPKDIRILVVDDQDIVRLAVMRTLKKHGFTCFEASDAFKTLAFLDREKVDLVLSDIQMPGMTGLALVKAVAHRIPEIAFVMVSSMDNTEMAMECLRHGAYGYVLKPFKTNDILIAVAAALRRRMLELEYRDREAILARRVAEQTVEIKASRDEVALRLISASEHRDNETGAHVRRIGLYAAEMARLLGWDEGRVETIQAAAPMHDIGKIGVPDRILQKDGRLTEEEWIIMRTHTTMGANILKNSTVPFIQMGARIAACHHERWDGTGYPLGLKGEAIPIEARITCLVDVYDALIHRRVYKMPWTEPEVLAYIRENAGVFFDPLLTRTFFDHLPRFREIMLLHPDRFAEPELP